MKDELFVKLYLALIGYFFWYSNGFVKFHGEHYAVFKTIPVLLLSTFAFLRSKPKVAALIFFGAVGDYIIGIPSGGIVPGSFPFGIGHLIALSEFYPSRRLRLFWPTALALALVQLVVGHFCIKPMLSSHPSHALILTLYSFTLAACFIVSSSHYFHASLDDPSYRTILLRFLGYFSFVLSDTSLILTETHYLPPSTELFILPTYYIAQLFISFSLLQ